MHQHLPNLSIKFPEEKLEKILFFYRQKQRRAQKSHENFFFML